MPKSGLSPELLSDFSLFNLPAHSLVFVYPGQFISKNILCAEVAQLMSAKIQKSNYELEAFSASVELAEVPTPTDRLSSMISKSTSLEKKTKEVNPFGTSRLFNRKAREGEFNRVQITSNNFHEVGFPSGIPAGPKIGKILAAVTDAWFENPNISKEQAIQIAKSLNI
jgi:hypothetical protein